MRKSQVNTGREDTTRGPITKNELKAFKRMIWPGDKLRCRYPRRRGDDEEKVGKMKVLKQYPHIVTLEYIGACGKTFETSMTWAEAIILNRRPQKKSKVS